MNIPTNQARSSVPIKRTGRPAKPRHTPKGEKPGGAECRSVLAQAS
jgi:hypothetical protein